MTAQTGPPMPAPAGKRPAGPALPAASRPLLVGLGAAVLLFLVLAITLFTVPAVFNVLIFLVFAALWLAFAAALVRQPASLDRVWRATRALPLAVQALIWLLLLPLMIGLWIWVRAWSLPVRVVLVAGVAFANLFMFWPR